MPHTREPRIRDRWNLVARGYYHQWTHSLKQGPAKWRIPWQRKPAQPRSGCHGLHRSALPLAETQHTEWSRTFNDHDTGSNVNKASRGRQGGGQCGHSPESTCGWTPGVSWLSCHTRSETSPCPPQCLAPQLPLHIIISACHQLPSSLTHTLLSSDTHYPHLSSPTPNRQSIWPMRSKPGSGRGGAGSRVWLHCRWLSKTKLPFKGTVPREMLQCAGWIRDLPKSFGDWSEPERN